MLFHVREIFRVPPDTVVHYVKQYSSNESFAHANFCGTFGYDLVHSDNQNQVTCRRCLHKIKLNTGKVLENSC